MEYGGPVRVVRQMKDCIEAFTAMMFICRDQIFQVFLEHQYDASEINAHIILPLPVSGLFRLRQFTPDHQYARISDPGFFTNSNWFPAMKHRCRDGVPAGIRKSR